MHTPYQPPCMPPSNHTCPPSNQPCPPGNHTCPPQPCTPPWQPRMPPSNHTPRNHIHPLPSNHSCLPGNHACPPCGQNQRCLWKYNLAPTLLRAVKSGSCQLLTKTIILKLNMSRRSTRISPLKSWEEGRASIWILSHCDNTLSRTYAHLFHVFCFKSFQSIWKNLWIKVTLQPNKDVRQKSQFRSIFVTKGSRSLCPSRACTLC